MNKRVHIFLGIILFLFGCSNTGQTNFEKLLNANDSKPLVNFDFSNNSNELISIIEERYDLDLCKTSHFISYSVPQGDQKKTNLVFTVFERCFPYMPVLGSVEIFLKSEKEIRIDFSYRDIDSVAFYVFEELISRFDNKEVINIQLEFEWREVSKYQLDVVFQQTFNALERFADKKSKQWHIKPLNDLTYEEFLFFSSCFNINLVITKVRPDPRNKEN